MLPTYYTTRLIVRPRSMRDFNDCLTMDRDREVTRFIPGPWNDPAAHEQFVRERIEKSLGAGLGYWSIFPKEQPDQFVGWVMLIPYDGAGPETEIGWRFNRAAWGQGFATEAARSIVAHAFGRLELQQIVADIDPGNVGSLRVAEKIGMRLKEQGSHGGVPLKSYVMTKNDYSALNVD